MKYEILPGPQIYYHGTGFEFEGTFKEQKQGLHLGSQSQAIARARGHLVTCEVTSELKVVRRKDCGGGWERYVSRLKSKGIDGIIYLNRHEGVPLQRIVLLRAKGITPQMLFTMSDIDFRKHVPEAHDSLLVFRPQEAVKIKEIAKLL